MHGLEGHPRLDLNCKRLGPTVAITDCVILPIPNASCEYLHVVDVVVVVVVVVVVAVVVVVLVVVVVVVVVMVLTNVSS